MDFITGLFYGVLAQILTFVQLQGQFKYEWMRTNTLIMSLIGVPLSYLYIYSVKHMVAHFDGNMWPSRLLGFSIGAVVFSIMSYLWFEEPLTLKTGVSLFLALCIMMIQLFWK
jgi:multidrug transporter EmrE-like cation transporter